MTILVVEDDAVQRRRLRFFLEQQGYRVIGVSNVSEALTCIQHGLPDALLLDAMLPDGSGLDVCRQIRQLPEGQTLPILLLTAYDIEPVIVEAFEAGATDFIAKPVNLKLLERRLYHLLRAACYARRVTKRRFGNVNSSTARLSTPCLMSSFAAGGMEPSRTSSPAKPVRRRCSTSKSRLTPVWRPFSRWKVSPGLSMH